MLLALYSTLWDTCLFPVLGMVPVRDVPRTPTNPLKCGHHVAPPVPRERKLQRKPLREGGRAPEAPQKSPPRLRTRFPLFLCSPLCGVATQRVLRTLLREVRRLSPGGTSGKRPPWDLQSQFWEWCPSDLKSTAPLRPPTGRILEDIRQTMYDLGHRANFDSATASAIMQLSAVSQTPATMQFSFFGRRVRGCSQDGTGTDGRS